jgi:hypothetical protein
MVVTFFNSMYGFLPYIGRFCSLSRVLSHPIVAHGQQSPSKRRRSGVYTRIFFCRLMPQSNRMNLVLVSHVVFLRIFPLTVGTLEQRTDEQVHGNRIWYQFSSAPLDVFVNCVLLIWLLNFFSDLNQTFLNFNRLFLRTL